MVPMINPVTLETVKHYAVASGMMVRGINPYEYTSAEAFLTAVVDTPESWLGATSGTTDIAENRKNWTPDHNGLRVAYKGSAYLDTVDPTIKATLVEMTPENIKLASGAATVEGEGTNLIKVIPRATITPDDYIEPVVWFTNYGSDGVIGCILHNALCVTGMNWKADDKKIGTCSVEFHGHASSPMLEGALPMEYFILKNALTQTGE